MRATSKPSPSSSIPKSSSVPTSNTRISSPPTLTPLGTVILSGEGARPGGGELLEQRVESGESAPIGVGLLEGPPGVLRELQGEIRIGTEPPDRIGESRDVALA